MSTYYSNNLNLTQITLNIKYRITKSSFFLNSVRIKRKALKCAKKFGGFCLRLSTAPKSFRMKREKLKSGEKNSLKN